MPKEVWLGIAAGRARRVQCSGSSPVESALGPRPRRRRRRARLHQRQMVDDEARIGVAVDHRGARIYVAPAQDVDRQVVPDGRARDAVETRVVRRAIASGLLRQHDADADRARRPLPRGDDVAHRRIVRIDRLDDREPAGMGPLHFHRIARVVAVQGKRRDEDRAVDADLVHGRHHLVTRNVIGPVRHAVPGSLRSVRFVSVDLGIDDHHRGKLLEVDGLVSALSRL